MRTPVSTAASLPEVHSSVVTARPTLLRKMLAFAGPAYLVSVGYMDPGNWATDLQGGASFGYRLLWVIVLSNAMAILLQTLAARLGIVAGRDLAQACREAYPRAACNALWVLCEIAIAACDLAEVLGAAIALKLLFGLPLAAGVLLTGLDTLLVLGNVNEGMREASVQPGEPVVLRPEAGVEWLEVTPPGGEPEKLTRGRRPDFIYANTDRVGLYKVVRDDGVRHEFAVNLLDARESDIEPRQRFKVGEDTVASGSERARPHDLWKWLVLAALGLLLLEWYVYNRRVGI